MHNPKGVIICDFEIAAIAIVNGVNKIATFNKTDFELIPEIEIIVPD